MYLVPSSMKWWNQKGGGETPYPKHRTRSLIFLYTLMYIKSYIDTNKYQNQRFRIGVEILIKIGNIIPCKRTSLLFR